MGTAHEFVLRDLDVDGVRVQFDGVDHPCVVAVHPDGSVWVNDPRAQSRWEPVPRLPEASAALLARRARERTPGHRGGGPRRAGSTRSAPGQKLVVVEAMKMEHPALASADGVVAEVHVQVGQFVEAKAVLVTLEASD